MRDTYTDTVLCEIGGSACWLIARTSKTNLANRLTVSDMEALGGCSSDSGGGAAAAAAAAAASSGSRWHTGAERQKKRHAQTQLSAIRVCFQPRAKLIEKPIQRLDATVYESPL